MRLTTMLLRSSNKQNFKIHGLVLKKGKQNDQIRVTNKHAFSFLATQEPEWKVPVFFRSFRCNLQELQVMQSQCILQEF